MTWGGGNHQLSENVWAVPCLSDNFAYLITDGRIGIAVDPVEPLRITELAKNWKIDVVQILTTHHHEDHAGGNKRMQEMWPTIKTIGGSGDAPPEPVQHLKVGPFEIVAIHTPVHTMDHICYYVSAPIMEKPVVFTGDFLFRAGCGYFFEGSPKDFDASVHRLYELCNVNDTLMCFGHEYCSANFAFAEHFEPDNETIRHVKQTVLALPPVQRTPSTLHEELEVNPFVRCVLRKNEIPQTHVDKAGTELLCGYARQLKNGFKAP